MTLWLSFLALAAGCRDKIRPSYTAADFYDPKSTFVSCWYTVEEQSPATISGFIASVLVAFNNYVDQILPNFDPPPPSSGQEWTFSLQSTFCHVTPVDFQLTPPPRFFPVVTECSLSGLLLNNFVLIFALLTSLHPQLRAAVVLAVKLTCQSFHFRIFEDKKSWT